MMNSARLLCTLLFCGLSFGLHVYPHPKDVWQAKQRAHSKQILPLFIALKQNNVDLLEQKVQAVSSPDSPEYGKYLSVDEVAAIVSPSKITIKKVISWLESHNAFDIDLVSTRDAINAKIRVGDAENLFNTKIMQYQHLDGREILRGSTNYRESIHPEISKEIDLILGISDFPLPSSKMPTKLKEAKLQTRSPSQSAGGTLNITGAFGRGKNVIQVEFIPTCMNGQSTNTIPPCADNPPVLSSVTTSAVAVSDVISDSFSSQMPPFCSNDTGSIICKSSVTVSYYHALNVSITGTFGSTTGPTSYNPFTVLTTPPIIPQSIAAQYNIPPNFQVTNTSITQCVVEFEQQYYSQSDLNLFMSEMGLPPPAPVTIIGPNDQTNPGGEANLDIQYIMGVAPGAPTTFWSIYANSTVEIDDILQWAIAVTNTKNPPLVNSISYGMSENQVDTYLGQGYVLRSDIQFRLLALRGVTIIIADGDTGAGDLGAPPMSDPTCQVLHPDWPSQSPYVTAVGSTYFTPWAEPICYLSKEQGGINCDNNPMGEVTTSMDVGLFWTTGGGFSNIQPTAWYQKNEVANYLSYTDAIPPSYAFNATGRAYPDVTAVGHNLMVYLGGELIPVDGTSASAPIFAGIVTLLNQVRSDYGKPPLGFINPMLYKIAKMYPEAFYDVTVGYNRCGAVDWTPACCAFGYKATPGFDAVSGLGTPNFAVLKELVLQF